MCEEHNIPKVYDPASVEKKWYKFWEEHRYFHAEVEEGKDAFSIVIPPPNITGQLHMGHALDNTLQDILIRWHRMMGHNTLWMPGYDHAGLATQIKVEEVIKKEEGKTRYDLGREEFLKRVWEWKEQYGDRIINQLKHLGVSCDWERKRFTMDEGCSKAVREVFCTLFEKGLIYKGTRITNWCVNCNTALSDIEVEHKDDPGHLWYINYPVVEEEGRSLMIATTRPETLPGDTAVAVNPEDPRYGDLVGKTLRLPTTDRIIPIIADSYVDTQFGTGAVKITPSHDPNDYEMGIRHNLPSIVVIGMDGIMTKEAGKYEGMTREECRKAIVADLKADGYLVKVEEHSHAVGHCQRCGHAVESQVSTQWFVKMEPLVKAAVDCVEDGRTQFVPERFTKTYTGWMDNIRDWCISRQIWWGHRIPVWYCDDCGEMSASRTDLTVCPKCGSAHIHQDEDALDTWFSSALWPFSTMGWPDKTPLLKQFYPTSVLVTGYDIIFFWVARMLIMGMEFMHEIPFDKVFIHGLVRDSQGRKMSKSLGNGIDPLEVIDKYGADTLRFMLITGNTPGNDMRFYWERVESSRNFANKVWNASRFIMMNLGDEQPIKPEDADLLPVDKWILSKVNTLAKDVTENMDKYELGIAVQKVYDFIWEEFCDWYIEIAKVRLYKKEEDPKAANTALWVLKTVLTNALKMLHPYMPFITEEIFCTLCPEEETIMLAPWPEYTEEWNFAKEEADVETIKVLVKGIRNIRSEMNVPPSRKAKYFIVSPDENLRELFASHKDIYSQLISANEIDVQADKAGIPEDAVSVVIPNAVVYIPLEELVDMAKERERLEKEKAKLAKELARSNGMLNNEKFLSKAPQAKVDEEKAKLEKYKQMMEDVENRLAQLK